jgi:hypothetical protein
MDFIATQSRKPPVSHRGIYWLASFPRSGNTWLRTFVSNLLDIVRGDPLPENATSNLLKYTAVERMEHHFRPFISWQDAVDHPLQVFKVRPQAQQKLANDNPHSIFVKTQCAAVIAGGIPQINALVTRGAAYLIRNPLDVACSFAPFYGVPMDEAIRCMGARDHFLSSVHEQVAEFVSSWSIHVQSWTETSKIEPFVLRYEDMLNEPLRAFTAFARHANINATREQIARAIELVTFSRLQGAEAAGRDVPRSTSGDKFFRVGKTGQWRDTLTPAQIDRIVSDHGTWMAKYGYLPEAAGDSLGAPPAGQDDAARAGPAERSEHPSGL